MKILILLGIILSANIFANNIQRTGIINVGSNTSGTYDRRDPTTISSKKYASDAVKMAKSNKVLGCGYGGGRWGLNWNDHNNWAKSVSRSELISEYNNRRKLLIQCIQKKY